MPLAEPMSSKKNSGPKTVRAQNQPGDVPLWRCGVLLGITVAMLVLSWFKPPLTIPAQAGVTLTLPDYVKMALPNKVQANFHGFNQEMSEAELEDLPKDTGFTRKQYEDFLGDNIFCTIVLSGAEQRSIHRPEACLPGQGWSILSQDDFPIRLASGHELVIRNLTIQREIVNANNQHQIIHGYYMYWFVGENVTTPHHFTRFLLSGWDRAIHNRVHRWAYVSVLAPVTDSMRPDGLNADQTLTMLSDFIRKIVPSFQKSEMAGQAAP